MNLITMNNKLADFLFLGIVLSLSSTILFSLVWAISPIYSNHDTKIVWTYLIAFNLIFIFTLLLLQLFFKSKQIRIGFNITNAIQKVDLGKVLIISTLGIILHCIAKYELVTNFGLDELGQLRSHWISGAYRADNFLYKLISAFGYILSHFSLFGLFISTFRISKNFLDKISWGFLLIFLTYVTIFSILIVTRMTFITTIMVVFSSGLFAVFSSQKRFHTFIKMSLVSFVVVFVSLTFNTYVFSNKIFKSNTDDLTYTIENLKGHSSYIKNEVKIEDEVNIEDEEGLVIDQNFIFSPNSSLLPTFFYLSHGILNFNKILVTNQRGKSEWHKVANRYLGLLGIILTNANSLNERVYGRGGATLPGAIYHDFGIIGLVIAPIIIAIIFLFSLLIMASKGFIWLGIAVATASSIIVLMSYLFIATSTLSFPFTVLPFLFYFIYDLIKKP